MAFTYLKLVSDGVRTLYPINFEYVSKSDVFVYKGTHADYANQLKWRWADDNTVELLDMNEVPSGTSFFIRRVMTRNNLVHEFENKGIRAGLVDQENYHSLYLLQELADGFISPDTVLTLIGPINMNGFGIHNLADAQYAHDAVNVQVASAIALKYANTTVDGTAAITVSLHVNDNYQSCDLKQYFNIPEITALTVFVQGVLQERGSAYSVSGTTVTFSEALDADTRVTFILGNVKSADYVNVETEKSMTQSTSVLGQTIFVAPAYNMGKHELRVSIQGVLQREGEAYIEIGNSRIELTEQLPAGMLVDIWRIK